MAKRARRNFSDEYKAEAVRLVLRRFFANPGEFRRGDYAEIMTKASALFLLSNAALAWSTVHIGQLVNDPKARVWTVSRDTHALSSSLVDCPIIPSGTYRFRSKRRS